MSAETYPDQYVQMPSLHGELQHSLEYADQNRFSDSVLQQKYQYYQDLMHDPDTTIRAEDDIATILSRLDFELKMRAHEAASV